MQKKKLSQEEKAAESKGEGRTRRKGSPVGQNGGGGRGRSARERKNRSFVSSCQQDFRKMELYDVLLWVNLKRLEMFTFILRLFLDVGLVSYLHVKSP